MNKRQRMQLESLDRGVLALAKLPDGPECAELRRMRDRLLARVESLKGSRDTQWVAMSNRGAGGQSSDLARRALRTELLIPISRRAKPLFKQEPQVLRALRVPRARATAMTHANAALAMARALRPHVKFCLEEGFRRGFLSELKTAGEQLRDAAKQSDTGRADLSRVTWRLRLDLRDARELASGLAAELKAATFRLRSLPELRDQLDSTAGLWDRVIKLQKPIGRPRKRGQQAKAVSASGSNPKLVRS